MAVTAQSPAPYTSGMAALNVLARFRDKGLSLPINGEVLMRAGVAEALVPRTIQALITLELIDDQGNPTETFKKIRSVPQAEYQACLAEWIHRVYADVFSFVDPATDDAVRVRDAFRAYIPHGQQDRMVALFMTLCVEAGLAPAGKKTESKQTTRKTPVVPRAALQLSRRGPGQQQHGRGGRGVADPSDGTIVKGLPPALTGLLQSIPLDKPGWTKETRDRFIATFTAVLDFVVPVVSAAALHANDDAEDET